MITIRNTEIQDIPQLRKIFAKAREFMFSTGNPNQWDKNYPTDEMLLGDIQRKVSYVCELNGRIVATFVLHTGIDPTYNIIEQGNWKSEAPYSTIHRIASNGECKGIFRLVKEFALQKGTDIRIDTHKDNSVMQHILQKEGFEYCGIIFCWNGDKRLAYQYQIK